MSRAHDPFFLTSHESFEGDRVLIEGADARHLAVVRRGRPGDRVKLSDGAGRIYEAVLTSVAHSKVEASITSMNEVPRPLPAICVFQGLAKGQKLDYAVQKLTEVGVLEIVVFSAGRSIPSLTSDKAARAQGRWNAIAREAAKQSRSPWVTEVSGPRSLDEASALAASRGLVLVLSESSQIPLREALPKVPPRDLALVIGPEGGLAAEEAEKFTGESRWVTLGTRILRTETAGLVAALAVMYQYGLVA